MELRAANDAPATPAVDPLAVWRVDLHLRRDDAVLQGTSLRVLAPELHRYLRVHARRSLRGPLPEFWADPLRQADLEGLGVTVHPPHRRLDEEELELCFALWREVFSSGRDEPLLERWLLHQAGFTAATLGTGFWCEVLEARRGDTFALDRARYALAALALVAGLHSYAPAFRALLDALEAPEPAARMEAALYLLAAYRIEGRAAPLDAIQGLDRMARTDPTLGVRFVARQLLELERLPLGPDPELRAVTLSVRSRVTPERTLQLTLRGGQTLADVHQAVQSRLRVSAEAEFGFVLDSELRAPRCVVLGQGSPRSAAELLLSELGLRAGDRFEYWFLREHVRRAWVDVLALSAKPLPVLVGAPWLLFRTAVHGTRFHDAPAMQPPPPPGTRLALRREPDNSFDDRAVEVRLEDGRKLGYVPRTRNRALATRMDDGEPVFALLERFDGPAESPDVEVALYVGAASARRSAGG